MRAILLLLLAGCVSDPRTPITGTKTAVLVEGLGDMPFLRNTFTEALKQKDYEVYSMTYKFKGPIAADVCYGHSFGGGRLMRSDVACGVVITMDAREWDSSKNDSYVSSHKNHTNYFQRSGLRGYPIKGAINHDMGFCGHLQLPREVFNKYSEVIL